MRNRSKPISSALLAAFALLANTAWAESTASIFYHEPIRNLVSISTDVESEELMRFDAFGRRFELRVHSNNGLLRFRGHHEPAFLRGRVSGTPESWVRLTRSGEKLSGIIRDASDIYVIEPRQRVMHELIDPASSRAAENIIYRLADREIPLDNITCSTELPTATSTAESTFEALITELSQTPVLAATVATRRVTIGIVGDHDLHELLAPNTETEILDRLNIVDGIFSEALGIEISVADVTVFSTAGSDPFSTGSSAKNLLDSVRDYRVANQLNLGLTHLITGRDLSGKTAGLAYVGQSGVSGVCTDTGAALTERGSSPFISALLIAHEIGHNMGAGHDGENKSGCENVPETYLMAPVINGNDEFSACSIQVMDALTRNASCIGEIPHVDLILNPSNGAAHLDVPLGGEFELAFEIVNVGTDTAHNVVAMLELPTALSLIDLAAQGGGCSLDPPQCVITSLASGSTVRVTATLVADSPGELTISLDVNTADDRDVTTNSQARTISVLARPDLRVDISGTSSLESGQTGQASVSIDNNSSVIATDVTVNVTTTNGLGIDNLASPDATCSDNTCTIASLPGAGSLEIGVEFTGDQEGAKEISVAVDANEDDIQPDDNTASLSISVVTPVTAPTSTNSSANSGGGGGGVTGWFSVIGLLLTAARKRLFVRR